MSGRHAGADTPAKQPGSLTGCMAPPIDVINVADRGVD